MESNNTISNGSSITCGRMKKMIYMHRQILHIYWTSFIWIDSPLSKLLKLKSFNVDECVWSSILIFFILHTLRKFQSHSIIIIVCKCITSTCIAYIYRKLSSKPDLPKHSSNIHFDAINKSVEYIDLKLC